MPLAVLLILVLFLVVVIIRVMENYDLEVIAKTPGLYQVPKLRNLNLNFFLTEGQTTDGQSDLYYPLDADKKFT